MEATGRKLGISCDHATAKTTWEQRRVRLRSPKEEDQIRETRRRRRGM
jgi:hypothetical protein